MSSDKLVTQDAQGAQGVVQDKGGSGLSISIGRKIDNDTVKLELGSSSFLYSHDVAVPEFARKVTANDIKPHEGMNFGSYSGLDSGGGSALHQSGANYSDTLSATLGHAGDKGKAVQMVVPTSCPIPSNSCKPEAGSSKASGSYSGNIGLHLGTSGELMDNSGGVSGPSVGTSGPCKRKTIEGSSEQSRLSCLLEISKNTSHVIPAHLNAMASPLLSGCLGRHDPRRRNDTWRGPEPSSVGDAFSRESASGTSNWRRNLDDQQTSPYYSISTQSAPLHGGYLPHTLGGPHPHTIVGSIPFSTQNVSPIEPIPGPSRTATHFHVNGEFDPRSGVASCPVHGSGLQVQMSQDAAISSAQFISPTPNTLFPAFYVAHHPYEAMPSGLAPINASSSTSPPGPCLAFMPGPPQPNDSVVAQQGSGFTPWPFVPSYNSQLPLDYLEFLPLPSPPTFHLSNWMAARHDGQAFDQFSSFPGISLNMQQHITYQFLPAAEPIVVEGSSSQDHIVFEPIVIEGVDMHNEYGDMMLDIDDMSYEQLLELEERIGNVESGLNEEKIMQTMNRRIYLISRTRRPSKEEQCCVCMEEFDAGEDVGTLNCGHEFHTHCIIQWLEMKNLCPICKEKALDA